MLTYFQAIVIGLFQGVTELVPISSLGHSVLLPEWLGWHGLVRAQSADESFYLAFLVALHVATALALLVHYRTTWVRIIKGFFTSIGKRGIETPDERLAWLLVVGTLGVGVVGLAFEHLLRTVFAKPAAAAVFLMVNGVILFAGERLRRSSLATVPSGPERAAGPDGVEPPGRQLDTLELKEGAVIGAAQILALFAGISRSGVTMVGGLLRGLNHEDAARFSFLLATPVIFAAGVYKIPDLMGPLGDGVRGQALAGGVAAFVAAYVAVRFLERWFERRTLTPFAVYCLVFGALSLVRIAA
ncbi:MAG: undecaprenyl-diphosphate phosphatase [Acidimicrobiia bacterium]|nr:undecaprenyl-diphosphate phosphatase [Acidimicrobiia bacterium]